MELKEFIKTTIVNISEAISECQDELKDSGTIVNPNSLSHGVKDHLSVEKDGSGFRFTQNLEFDVSLSIEDQKGKSGKAGINVSAINLGGDKSSNKKEGSYSRLKFTLPVAFNTTSLKDS